MIKDKTQKQESGDNSELYQAETINQYGISYRDAKEIALDVFQQNFLILSEQAKQTAKARVEEITNKFLDEIKEKNPNLLNSVQEPSMQNALYTAQKSYAISGDKDTADLLVDILVERAEQNERNLIQIVLDESLEVVPKLTTGQLDALTLKFIITSAIMGSVTNLRTFGEFLKSDIKPFTQNLTKNDSDYLHLEYCKCASIGVIPTTIERAISGSYRGIFCKGMLKEKFEEEYGSLLNYPNMIARCLRDKDKIQVNALNENVFYELTNANNLSEEFTVKLKSFFDSNFMSDIEIKLDLLEQAEFMKELYDVWENSGLRLIRLTTVGIAIAQANYRRKTKNQVDLSIWIK